MHHACVCAQRDLCDMEEALELWCPEEHRARLRFAITECAAIDWSGVQPARRAPPRPGLPLGEIMRRAAQSTRGWRIIKSSTCAERTAGRGSSCLEAMCCMRLACISSHMPLPEGRRTTRL